MCTFHEGLFRIGGVAQTHAELGQVGLPSSRPESATGLSMNATQMTKIVGSMISLMLQMQDPYTQSIAKKNITFSLYSLAWPTNVNVTKEMGRLCLAKLLLCCRIDAALANAHHPEQLLYLALRQASYYK